MSAPPSPVVAELVYAPGVLTYRDARYLLIRPETLAAVQRAVEGTLGAAAADCFAAGGRAGGSRAVDTLGGETRERLEELCRQGTAIGWGEFSVEALAASSLTIAVRRSPFAEAYGPSPTPVCHLTRGVLEALTSRAFAGTWTVEETRCLATGAPDCRFQATQISV